MSDEDKDRKGRSSAYVVAALALVLFTGVGIFALERQASHPVVWEKGALCGDWVGEIGVQTTCPHRDHFLVFQPGSRGNDPFMLCKCPAKKSAATPDEVWLHPGTAITLRCSVTGTRLRSDYSSDGEKHWCE